MRRIAALIAVAMSIAACGGDGGFVATTSTTTTTTTTAPTTTTAAPTTTTAAPTTTTRAALPGLPAEVVVESLAWSGSFAIFGEVDGIRSGVSGTLTGAFIDPDQHEIEVDGETGTIVESSDELTGVERIHFRAVAIGDKVLIEEDGDVEQADLEDEVDDRFGVMSTGSGGILPTPEMLAVLASSDGDSGSVGDRPANLYAFEGMGAEPFLALFIDEAVAGELGGVESLVVRVAVDPLTGVVLESSMEGILADARDAFTLEMAYTVTALDDPATTIEIPGLVPGALVPYEEPDGRFTISYPVDWDVDEYGSSTEFTHPAADDVYVAVLVEGAVPGDGSLDAYVGMIFAEAPDDLEILEEATVEHGGLTWRYFDLSYSEEGERIHANAWLTVAGGTGYALAVAADPTTMTALGIPSIALQMFETFTPTP